MGIVLRSNRGEYLFSRLIGYTDDRLVFIRQGPLIYISGRYITGDRGVDGMVFVKNFDLGKCCLCLLYLGNSQFLPCQGRIIPCIDSVHLLL